MKAKHATAYPAGVGMAANTPLDADAQLILNHVCGLMTYHMERQRDAGRTPAEMAEAREALIAGIVETMRRSPQPMTTSS